ncbi:MAG: hypothetical protein JXP34_20380, partial [Planctomycetes bacterium]|nr:hypothetical protein [Planctomycetota bacterium]
RGILFAPHDNYIDLYPDADGFTYDRICFREDGRPVRAWLNEGRGAQSFRFRPDTFEPFLRANVERLARDVRPTAYFIDVFSSIGLFDYYERSGAFHSRTETQRRWGEAFAWIRDRLNGAPQVSESGHDGLIGWLDGAQTNHLRVDAATSSWTTWRIRCADAERIPWYDLAYHDRFVLHGAGYSSRYEGGLSAAEHGIDSDDYVTTEVLTGHPAMVPSPFGAPVVRKYWLTHDLLDAVALVPIAEVAFEGDDIHRQTVRYENGAAVRANRSAEDWVVDGHVLPPYGFRARAEEGGGIEAAIERIDGAIVEWARGPAAFYANPRAVDPQGRVQIRPVAASVRPLGGRTFEIEFAWDARRAPLDADYRVFVHFVSQDAGRAEREGIAFQADHDLPAPATEWRRGINRSRTRFDVPASVRPGRYPIAVGLWLPANGRRLPLLGPSFGRGRVQAGTLVLAEGAGGGLAASIEPPPADPAPRWNVEGKPVDFGWVRTDGAFRIIPPEEVDPARAERTELARVLPLPDSPAFTIELRADRIPWLRRAPRTAEAFDLDGKSLGAVAVETAGGGAARLRIPAGIFDVRLR